MSNNDSIKKIQQLLKNKEYKKVVDSCEIEKMKGKSSTSLYYMEGVAHYGLENIEKAKELFCRTLSLDEEHANSIRYLIEIYLKEEDWTNAIPLIQKMVNKTKNTSVDDCVKYLRKLLKIYENMGNNEKVVEILLQIIDLSKSNEKTLSVARKKLINYLSYLPYESLSDILLYYDLFAEMKESQSPTYSTYLTQCTYLTILNRLYSFYQETKDPQYQQLIHQFTDLCTDGDYPAFTVEARLSHSFMDDFYIPVDDRRSLALSVYSPSLNMKKLNYLSLYSLDCIKTICKEKNATYTDYFRGLLMNKVCESVCVLRELFYTQVLSGDSDGCYSTLHSLQQLDLSQYPKEKQSIKEEEFVLALLLQDETRLSSLVAELQEVDWMNNSMKRLLQILPCIYLNQYDSFMQVIKDEEESTEVVFMKLFVLIHLRQFDPIPTLLQQYPSIQNQAGILSLYQALQHLQSVQKDTAYTDIIKPLEDCLNLPVSSNLLTLLMDRLVYEEACISLGSFYQSYYQDDEKAILYYQKLFTINKTHRKAIEYLIPCCYRLHDYSLLISNCESILSPSLAHDYSLLLSYHIAHCYSLLNNFEKAASQYQQVIVLATSIQEECQNQDELVLHKYGQSIYDLASWFAICRHYKCESECYLSLKKVNSACRVIQYCIQLCQDHFSLSFEPILQESDTIHHFFMDAILFEADILFLMNSFEEEQSLLLSLYPSEPSSSYYHIDLLQYHLAKCSFSSAVQKYNQGSISLSQDLLQQAYQYISYTEKSYPHSKAVLELKASILHQFTMIACDINSASSTEYSKQLDRINQKQILFDPENITAWSTFTYDRITIQQHTQARFSLHSNQQPSSSSSSSSFQPSLLKLVRSLISHIAKDSSKDHHQANINALFYLWISLSLLDPRREIQEMALLETVNLVSHYHKLLTADPGIAYSYYAFLLIQGKAYKQASSILSLGRAISPSNTLLLFLDSYVHYLQQDSTVSQQLAETCSMLSTLPEASTLFLLLFNSTPSESTKGLIIQCCALLLRTSNYHLHLLCAKSLFRLKQYHKVQTICQAICSNTTDDPLLTHSAQQLSYLASQLAKPDIQPSDIYSGMKQSTLTSIEPSYFQESGLIKHLLEGAVSPESLENSSSLEAQFYKTIIQSPSLSLSQKVQKLLLLNPSNLYYQYLFFLTHSSLHLHNQTSSLPLSKLIQFGSSFIHSLYQSFDRFSSWYDNNPFFKTDLPSILLSSLQIQTLLQLTQGTAVHTNMPSKAILLDPSNIQSWEILTIQSIFEYMMMTPENEEESKKKLNSIRRLLQFIINEIPPDSVNGIVFSCYYHLFTLSTCSSSIESIIKSKQDLSQMSILLVFIKQSYIFDQEITGMKEKGAVNNLQTVLKTNKALTKMDGINNDKAFQLDAESALIFYKSKSYDYALRYLENMKKSIKDESWKWIFIYYTELLCYYQKHDTEKIEKVKNDILNSPDASKTLHPLLQKLNLIE